MWNSLPDRSNIKTYFYRFEFQKRGTLHLHLLVWLDNAKYIQLPHFRGDLPPHNGGLRYFVETLQKSTKSSLPINNGATTVENKESFQIIRFCHPADAQAAFKICLCVCLKIEGSISQWHVLHPWYCSFNSSNKICTFIECLWAWNVG